MEKSNRKCILDLCKTRWAERHLAFQHFYQAFTFIVEGLEMIGYQLHIEEHGDTFGDWDSHNRSEAQQLLASITSFDFIVVFMTVYQYLSHLSGITVKLQNSSIDIVEAYAMIEDIRAVYKHEREDVDKGFKLIYDQSHRMAEKVGTTPSMPRVAIRQQHRSNIVSLSPLDYYQKNVAIPFLDHICTYLDEQFSTLSVTASSLLSLVPIVMHKRSVDLSEVIIQYSNDLPSPELVERELLRWKSKYSTLPMQHLPISPSAAIKECDAELYPNIRILLQIACTIPATSCECERSASALRRLNNYMRASMGKERMANLALLHIHYDKQMDVDRVVDIYSHLHSRRMELDSLISP